MSRCSICTAWRVALVGLVLLAGCSSETERLWTVHDGYRVRPLPAPVGTGTGFTEISDAIAFGNHISASALVANRHVVNGSGVAIGDVDGDSLPDVFLAGMEHHSTLHRNLGAWEFQDVTLQAGLGLVSPRATGAVFTDVDADGDLDLLITSLGSGVQLFVNDGTGSFTDQTGRSNLPRSGGATSVALADMDADRDLDLYIGFYKEATVKDVWPPEEITFERVVEPVESAADSFAVREYWAKEYTLIRQQGRWMRIELAEPDRIFFNDGNGNFTEGSFTEGRFLDEHGDPLTEVPQHWTLSVRFQDFNQDGYPDLYVCNDFESPDALWFGSADGVFRAASTLALRKTSQSTMSVAAADINADGHVDLFLADMLGRSYTERQRQHFVTPPEVLAMGDIRARPQEMQNMLLLNRQDSTYTEIARWSGIAASGWTWSSAFTDVDLDGWPDLLLTTGHAYDAMDADAQLAVRSSWRPWRETLLDFPDLDLPNVAFRNIGNAQFEWVEAGWGLGENPDAAHGMAFADLDGDGDQDVVINRLDGPVGVFRNDAEAERILVRLQGLPPNPAGVGAVIRVDSDRLPLQSQEVIAGGEYLSSSDAARTFAYASGAVIEVHWPGGGLSRVDEVAPNHEYWISKPPSAPGTPSNLPSTETLFRASTTALQHEETSYTDFARQPLLPYRLSQRGPALIAVDMDSDGDEDLILGGGKGKRLQLSVNDGGTFATKQYLGSPAAGDHAGMAAVPGFIWAAMGNYERTPEEAGDASQIIRISAAGKGNSYTFGAESPGPLALGDFTGDGSLELFVGGSFIPGQYPAPASSSIFQIMDGELVRDDALSAPFENLGLVSGAVAVDLNGDGMTDLALATMWGPVQVFHNRGAGELVRMTRSLGLADFTGWWNGIAPADFDGDGRLDLVVTNWGQNVLYDQNTSLRVYYGDLDQNSSMDLLEVQWSPDLDAYGLVRDFRALTHALPALRQRVQTYREFSVRPVADIFGPVLSGAAEHEVTRWQTTVFMNRGEHYEAIPLAEEAQWSPAFAPVSGDFNGDGRTDLFLSQNFFAVASGYPRLDSGRGLLLLADESHELIPQPAQQSGIQIYGSQRASVAADFNLDGRLDLAVTQNAGPVVHLENQRSRMGLRVELQSGHANAMAIGAKVRAEYQDGSLGPVTAVVAGSGYWGQNTLSPLLAPRSEIEKVHVTWPGGADTTVIVQPEVQMLRITQK